MSNTGGQPYHQQQPQIAAGGFNQQSFNPYDSYTSSTATYYDPPQNNYSSSKPSTYGQPAEFRKPGLQNAMESQSAVELGHYQREHTLGAILVVLVPR